MALKVCELISIVLLMGVSGMYWGPWLALSRSLAAFEPEVFLPIVNQMGRNMGPLMTVLTPVALLSTVPVLFLAYQGHPVVFYLTLTSLILFVITLAVTMLIEVPIVGQMTTWTASTLPSNWRQLRDRWVTFHLARIIPSVIGLVLFLIAGIF